MNDKSADRVFRKKRDRRRALAKLPFEEKIRIIVELQKAAFEIRKDSRFVIWPL